MSKKLQILLYVMMVWLTVMGVLFLFFPSAAEKIMSADLPDKALNMLYGQVVLTFAYVAFLAAQDGDGLSRLSRLLLALALGHVIVFAYQLIVGLMSFSQVGVALIVNAIFTILLFFFRRDIKK